MEQKIITSQDIKSCKHPKGKKLFAANVTIVALILLIVLVYTLFKRDIIIEIKKEVVNDFLTSQKTDPDQKLLGTWDVQNSQISKVVFNTNNSVEVFDNTGNSKMSQKYQVYADKYIVLTQLTAEQDTLNTTLKQENIYTLNKIDDNTISLTGPEFNVQAVRNIDTNLDFLYTYIKESSDKAQALVEGISFYEDNINIISLVLVLMVAAIFIWAAMYSTYTSSQISGIKITPEQFPRSYSLFKQMAAQLGFEKTPELYLKNGNGVYNAYASCVPGYRNYAVVHAEILKTFEEGGDERIFMGVMGHELGHVKLGHTSLFRVYINMILSFIPVVRRIFATSFSRLQEYEADKVGALLAGEENMALGLTMLVSDNVLYKKIDIKEYHEETMKYSKFFMFVNNFVDDHAIIPYRVDTLLRKIHGGLFFHKIKDLD